MSFNSLIRGLFARDPSIWDEDRAIQVEIANRLGWLDGPQFAAQRVAEMLDFAHDVCEAGFQHVVLLAMGGSCLASEVMARVAGAQAGWPTLKALDSTSPEQIANIEDGLDLSTTLFVVASKSGNTIETRSLYLYFRQQLLKADLAVGDHMAAITDAGSELEQIAQSDKFRACFLNPANIGGRYSAISYFGLVPAALIGLDVKAIVAATSIALAECEAGTGRGVRLGEWIGENWQSGRDKLGLVLPGNAQPLGWWIEQLLAESLGKQGKGVLPWLADLPSGDQAHDMFFAVWGDSYIQADVQVSEHLMPQGEIRSLADLGAEFIHWQVATALAGGMLEVNPFDEPNVTEAKQMTSKILAQGIADMASAGEEVSTLVSQLGENDYLNVLAYLPDTEPVRQALDAFLNKIRKQTHRPVLLSWGPRYLHSSGQLHKGGPNQGVFIVLVGEAALDKVIPGEPFGFRTLMLAQAQGDFKVLVERNRRAGYLRVPIDGLASCLASALSR